MVSIGSRRIQHTAQQLFSSLWLSTAEAHAPHPSRPVQWTTKVIAEWCAFPMRLFGGMRRNSFVNSWWSFSSARIGIIILFSSWFLPVRFGHSVVIKRENWWKSFASSLFELCSVLVGVLAYDGVRRLIWGEACTRTTIVSSSSEHAMKRAGRWFSRRARTLLILTESVPSTPVGVTPRCHPRGALEVELRCCVASPRAGASRHCLVEVAVRMRLRA